MLKIHETTTPDGALAPVFLRRDGDALVLVDERSAEHVLPPGALAAVLRRFGTPLEPDAALAEVDRLPLGGGGALRHVRHLARYDVIAKDWLVYESPGEEPLCALATTVAGALAHLARRERA